jgi:hypothetical protein
VRIIAGLVLSLSLICSVFFTGPAMAMDVGDSAAIALLEKAAAKAAMLDPQTRYAFTLERRSQNNDDEAVTIRARFDPRWPTGERWRLLDQDIETASEDTLDALKFLQKSEEDDEALVYDKLGEMLVDVKLKEETPVTATFIAPVKDDELPPDVLEAEITLNKLEGYVSRIALRSIREFKPVAIAKVKSLSQIQTFTAPVGDGPALLNSSENAARGKAMFRKFDQHMYSVYFDIERIDPAEITESNEE